MFTTITVGFKLEHHLVWLGSIIGCLKTIFLHGYNSQCGRICEAEVWLIFVDERRKEQNPISIKHKVRFKSKWIAGTSLLQAEQGWDNILASALTFKGSINRSINVFFQVRWEWQGESSFSSMCVRHRKWEIVDLGVGKIADDISDWKLKIFGDCRNEIRNKLCWAPQSRFSCWNISLGKP